MRPFSSASGMKTSGATQPPPPAQTPQQPPPRFRAETNLVRVDVYATKDGVPVQDLTAADFEVSEDNTPQKVDTAQNIVNSRVFISYIREPETLRSAWNKL